MCSRWKMDFEQDGVGRLKWFENKLILLKNLKVSESRYKSKICKNYYKIIWSMW